MFKANLTGTNCACSDVLSLAILDSPCSTGTRNRLVESTPVVYKLEFDAKSHGRTEAKQHVTPKLQTHSLTKSIRHQNACLRGGVHTQERNF